MKIAKWNEKAEKILDRMLEFEDDKLRFCNVENGVLFCDWLGTWCIFCPNSVVAQYGKPQEDVRNVPALEKLYNRAINGSATIADVSKGTVFWNGNRKEKCRKFENENGIAYVREKFLRVFPKNTLFYMESPNKPIICGIWENDRLYTIAIVLPFLLMGEGKFKAD